MVGAQAAAQQLLSAWQAPHQIEAINPSVRPHTRGEGYAVQQALFEATGDKAIGWKIAATSTAGQAHIGVSGPLAGRLLASRCLPDGAAVSMRGNVMHVIEAEFAFRMGADVLAVGDAPLTVQQVMAQVAELHLAIEIPNSRYQDFVTAGEAQLIADFACASHMVLGPALTTDFGKAAGSPGRCALALRRDSTLFALISGAFRPALGGGGTRGKPHRGPPERPLVLSHAVRSWPRAALNPLL